MSTDIRIKNGLSINIKGVADKELKKVSLPTQLALILDDFHLIVPKLLVKEGQSIKRGQPIFYSKANEEIKFVSPSSGFIEKIVRGDRRKIIEILIKTDKKDLKVKHKIPNLNNLKKDQVVKLLLESGCWPFIKQRPFDIIANPDEKPKSIHVSCFDSAPLSVDFEFILKDRMDLFKAGLNVLEILCPKNVNLGINKSQTFFKEQLSNYKSTVFEGPHPSGNVGVQIHHVNPINSGESVWILKPEDVCTIGNLFLEGEYIPTRTIAVSGPPVKNPKYFRTIIGAKIESILKNINFQKNQSLRLINGDVLSGKSIGVDKFIGFYNNNLSILKEGNHFKLFGWIPFINNSVPSIYRSSFNWLSSSKPKEYDTNLNGEERAFVVTGEMEKVFPMDIYPMQLVKECMIGNIEKMERLGIYEVAPEDFGLIDYASSSKIEAQTIVRNGIDFLIKETL